MENNTFKMIDENGVEKEYEVLFVFHSNETGKHYLAYTDNSTDENGDYILFGATFDPTKGIGNEMELHALESDEEWTILKRIADQEYEENNE